jgi:hypothetical protein
MNYFKGSGSSGVSVSPNYKKIKSDLEKSILNQNVLIQKKTIKH